MQSAKEYQKRAKRVRQIAATSVRQGTPVNLCEVPSPKSTNNRPLTLTPRPVANDAQAAPGAQNARE